MSVLAWFLWRRWQFKSYIQQLRAKGRNPAGETSNAFHNTNLAGCRKHPVIYNDMYRIVRGGK